MALITLSMACGVLEDRQDQSQLINYMMFLKCFSSKVYRQERGEGFYLLVRPQNLWLEHGAKWAVVDSLDPENHEIHLWSKTGGTQSPTDNLEKGDQKGSWYFNNYTETSKHNDRRHRRWIGISTMVEGDININCIEPR